MSKKCCGIIYNENEKFCTRCGKPLIDTPEEETPLVLDMSEVDKIAASVRGEVEKEQETKEETVSEDASEEQTNQEKSREEQVVAVEETASQPETAEQKKEKAEDTNDHSDDDDDDEDDEDDGKASVGLKLFGTLMIIIMLASITAVGLGIYFVKLNPFYKDHNINEPVVYEGVATDTDVNNVELTPLLTPVSIEVQTSTDAVEEIATVTDAEDTEETEDENEDSEDTSESEE